MISVNGISKSFKEVKAVVDVSLEFEAGESVAVLGPNGAGKTTLVEMIEGIRKPDAGSITIQGKSWNRHEKHLRRIMGISLQETRFIDKLTVREIMDLFSGFYSQDGSRIERILELIGLEEKSSSYTVNLSGGQRQKLALGIALINDPEILILDEPTTGLDPNARREMWAILEKLKSDGVLLILTTHYMEEAEYLCERIVFMDKGVILAEGTLDSLLEKHKAREIISFALEEGEVPDGIDSLSGAMELIRGENGTATLFVDEIVTTLPELLSLVKARGLNLKRLECRKMNLDDLFVSLTGRSLDA